MKSQPLPELPPIVKVEDPLRFDLDRRRDQLAEAEARLLEQLRRLDLAQAERARQEEALTQEAIRRRQLEQARAEADRVASAQRPDPQLETSLTDLQARQEQLLDQLRDLERQPAARRSLRYHVPVSKAVTFDEWHFECQNGRATFFPLGDLEAEINREIPRKIEALHQRWEVTDVTPVIGAFRLRYTAVRRKAGLDELLGGNAGPHPREGFGGYVEWEAQPVALQRGETAEQALTEGSGFRRLVDRLDGSLSAVTFWVYPDSFGVYRQLRDYLVPRGFTVAARPLPYGKAIAGSPRGSASQGQ
jgi:hypothetical protein